MGARLDLRCVLNLQWLYSELVTLKRLLQMSCGLFLVDQKMFRDPAILGVVFWKSIRRVEQNPDLFLSHVE